MSAKLHFFWQKLTPAKIRKYHEQGFLLLGQTLTTTGVDLLKKQCMDIWAREKEAFNADESWLNNSLLVNIHRKSDIVRKFYFSGPLVDIVEQLIGPNIKGVTSQLTFKMIGNTMPFGWHQDNGYGELSPYNAISTLTALDDTDEENGCLRIIPGSHKQGQIDVSQMMNSHTKAKGVPINLEVDETHAIPIPLKVGESLIFDCATLHKSEGNFSKNKDRRMLFLRYADADAIEVYNNGQPRLGKLIRGKTKFPEVEQYEKYL